MLPVNNIYSCIQGEGVKSGIPMVMLRLQGCDVGCQWCDTKETWKLNNEVDNLEDALGQNDKFVWLEEYEIVKYIKEQYPTFEWILLSGGEPAQYKLNIFLMTVYSYGLKVSLETSGTELGHITNGSMAFDWICVSPKIDMPGGKQVQKEAVKVADEIKFVIGKENDLEKLYKFLKTYKLKKSCQICLQPISQNKKATQLCIDAIQKHNWRLSIQIHKYLEID